MNGGLQFLPDRQGAIVWLSWMIMRDCPEGGFPGVLLFNCTCWRARPILKSRHLGFWPVE